jgi:secreted trypsin-like serine protease
MRRDAGIGLFFLSVLLASCSTAPAPSSLPRVVGGEPAGAAPFIVGILDDGDISAYCGGTLIAPRVVVTAAHCVDTPSRRARVAAGVSLNGSLDRVTTIGVSAIRLHPGFDVKSLQNDIALLFLAPYDPAALPGPVEPLALNDDKAMPEAGQPAAVTAIGWGNTSSYGSLYRPELRQATLPVVPVDTCKTLFGFATVTDQQICAGRLDGGGVDACQGDSGGPLVQGDKLVGIVSWGHGCAQAGKPGVFTRISSYTTWIAEETARFLEPASPPDGQALADLVQAYCYPKLEQRRRVAADDGSVLTIREHLRMAGALEPAPPSKLAVDGDEICALDDLPGVGSIRLRAGATHMLVEENGHLWQVPRASSSRVSLTCPSAMLMSWSTGPISTWARRAAHRSRRMPGSWSARSTAWRCAMWTNRLGRSSRSSIRRAVRSPNALR